METIVIILAFIVIWGLPSLILYFLDARSSRKISEKIEIMLQEGADERQINEAFDKKGWVVDVFGSQEVKMIRKKETSKNILAFLIVLIVIGPLVPVFLIYMVTRKKKIIAAIAN